MHEELWDKLAALDCSKVAQRVGCESLHEPERCILKLLNTDYVIDIDNRKIYASNKNKKSGVDYPEQLCLLAYLINAKESALAGKLVKAVSLPGGAFFFRGNHELPTSKLANTFGNAPELLERAGNAFGGKILAYGDAAIELPVLPKVPIVFIIWRGDDEFEARSSMLFDKSAAGQLPLDALWCASRVAANTLIETAKSL